MMNKEMIVAQAKADKKRGLELDPLNPDDLENVMIEYGYDDEELAIYKDAYFGSKIKEAKGNKASINNKALNASIKDFYTQTYPTDELGLEINDAATFKDLLVAIKDGKDYEDVIGFQDSTVRERLFDKLANILGVSYEKIYYLWLDQDSSFLNEASVKEVFSYENDEFFTREEVDDFAEKVCDHVNETFNEVFKVQESYITNNEIEVVVYNDDLGEFTGKKKVDMRRIRKPSDLDKYVLDIAADIIEEIKEVLIDSDYHDADEDELRKMGVFDESIKEDSETINSDFIIEDGVLVKYKGEDEHLTIPNSVTSIGKDAFRNNTELISVEIPDSVKSIGKNAFYDCYSIRRITIGNSVTSIGRDAFCHCKSLRSVVIPDSVTSIGRGAFFWCQSVTSVTIGKGVTEIGFAAFEHCDSLKSIIIPDNVTSIDDDAFRGCYSLTIYCEAPEQPSTWESDWNSSNCKVVWGYNKSNLTEDSDDGAVEGRYTLSLERIPSTGDNLSSWKVVVEADSEEDALKDFKAFVGEDSGIEVRGINPTTKTELEDKSIRVLDKHPIHEDSDVDGPYSYKETEAELQSLTQNWTREKDQLKCGYDEEKNYGMEILSKHGYECNADKQGGWWIVDYWKDLDSDKKGVRFGKAKKAIDFDPITYDEDIFKPGTIVEFMEDVLYGDAEVVAEAELDKYPVTDAEVDEFITKHGFKMSGEDKGMFYIPRGTRAKFIGELDAGPSWPMFEVNGIELEFAGDEPFKVSIIDDSITEATTMRHGWYGSRYTDYNKEDGWTDEDIAKHKEIDWQERNYHDYPIPEDSFTGEAIAHTDNGTKRARVKFIKYLRSNPIFPPYYAPENNPFTDVVGPMYNGNKHGSYGIHDMYESQDIYDTQSH